MQPQNLRRAPSPIVASSDAARAKKWPLLARILFIVAAASLCWAIPAAVIYWLLS